MAQTKLWYMQKLRVIILKGALTNKIDSFLFVNNNNNNNKKTYKTNT